MRTTRSRSTDPANTTSPVPGPLGSPLVGEGPAPLDLRSNGEGPAPLGALSTGESPAPLRGAGEGPAPLDGAGDGSAVHGSVHGSPTTEDGAAPVRPANRAERRAARRGRASESAGGPAVPRNAGPAPHAKPVHVRTDFAARRSG